jgi:hypothetical protein
VVSIRLSPRAAQLAEEALQKSRDCTPAVREETIKAILQATLTDEELTTLARMQARCMGKSRSDKALSRGISLPWRHRGAPMPLC